MAFLNPSEVLDMLDLKKGFVVTDRGIEIPYINFVFQTFNLLPMILFTNYVLGYINVLELTN